MRRRCVSRRSKLREGSLCGDGGAGELSGPGGERSRVRLCVRARRAWRSLHVIHTHARPRPFCSEGSHPRFPQRKPAAPKCAACWCPRTLSPRSAHPQHGCVLGPVSVWGTSREETHPRTRPGLQSPQPPPGLVKARSCGVPGLAVQLGHPAAPASRARSTHGHWQRLVHLLS